MRNHPILRRARRIASAWGFNPETTKAALTGFTTVRDERKRFDAQRSSSRWGTVFPAGRPFLQYKDRVQQAGSASGHYFHQDLLVAREVFQRAPRRHIDVGSSISGFVSHVAAFRQIEVIDIRPLSDTVQGITFLQADMMDLDPTVLGTSDSVSCLHALEHFGLGRYGDPIDFDGWYRGLLSLDRLVEPGGRLYLSVPTGERPRVEFNAHRVFSIPLLREVLLESYTVDRLAFVDDSGRLHGDVEPFGHEASRSFGADYGCSIWCLTKHTKVAEGTGKAS